MRAWRWLLNYTCEVWAMSCMRLCLLQSAPAFLPTLYTLSLHAAVAPALLPIWYTLSLLAAVYPSTPANLLHFVSECCGCPSTPVNLLHFACLQPYQVMLFFLLQIQASVVCDVTYIGHAFHFVPLVVRDVAGITLHQIL